MPLVRDVMSSPVISVVPAAPVSWVTTLLEKRGFSAAPVIDMGGLAGIVSLTDLLRVRSERNATRVRACMTKDVATVRDLETLTAAARRLAEKRVHRLVVTSDGLVAGILTARDVLDALGDDVAISDPIATIMTTDVQTVDIDDPIALATDRLAQARVHGLVVLDGSSPVGVFTRTEALAARHLSPERAGVATVGDVMSHETICIDVATPIQRVVRFVRSMNVRRILAVKQRRLAGVLSVLDLVGAAARSDVRSACSP
jgi:predicted transcriptional regulator